jgi:hypothetical protein
MEGILHENQKPCTRKRKGRLGKKAGKGNANLKAVCKVKNPQNLLK